MTKVTAAAVSQADLARAAGVSRKTITEWKVSGLVVLQGKSVDLGATLAKLRRCHRDGPAIADRVTAALAPSVTRNRSTPRVTPSACVGNRLGAHLADPAERAVVEIMPSTAYRVGAAAALAAHELGMPVEAADRLLLQVTAAAMELACMALDEAGIAPPPGASGWDERLLFDEAKIASVDWSRL